MTGAPTGAQGPLGPAPEAEPNPTAAPGPGGRFASGPGGRGPVELPWHWSLDDAPYALFSIKSPRPIFPNSHIREVFQTEFQEIHRWGGLYNLVMHPQVIGHRYRMQMLERLIQYMRSKPGVWFATHEQIARYVQEQAKEGGQ